MLLRFLLVLAFLAVPLAGTASADPGTGGAARNPNPPPLTAGERRALSEKLAAVERARARGPQSRSSEMVTMANDYGWVWTDIFMEPQSEPGSANWCGPGSTTAVITNWNNLPYTHSSPHGTGPIAYMEWLARDGVPGIGPMVVTDPNTGRPITYDTTLQATANNQAGQSFYFIQNVGGLSNFHWYLDVDLNTYDRPFFSIVWTNGLPGWVGYGVAHYQWLVEYQISTNYIRYGDSAGPNATCCGQNPYGFHSSVSMSDYYSHVQDSRVWDEIIW